MAQQSILPLQPAIQHYAWGDRHYLPAVFGQAPDGRPWAEAWYGAHPQAPAGAVTEHGIRPLDAVLEEQGAAAGELPYLIKLLACDRPLSIQVHPNRAQAEAGFAREEAAGIPLTAAHRNYCDRYHKPEIFVALTPFHALAGFRRHGELPGVLRSLPEIASLLSPPVPSADGLRALLEEWFALDPDRRSEALSALLRRLAAQRSDADRADPGYWALRAHEMLSGSGAPDPGLLFVFLLQLCRLEPGEAIFLGPGVPHAYLEGAGIELMTNSDNVLRAGLTPKHVDRAELMDIVRFDAGPVRVQAPVELQSAALAYPAPVADFALLRLTLGDDPAQAVARGRETILAEPGSTVTVRSGEQRIELSPGEACLVPAGTRYALTGRGHACVASPAVEETTMREASPESLPASFRGRSPRALAFGTSGLRGLVDDITDLEAYVNTRGFLDYLVAEGHCVAGNRIALGGDLRPSSERILQAVAKAVVDAGMEPRYQGVLPTPALTAWAMSEAMASIMVTGSHIPFDRNGIKFNRPDGEVLKSDEVPILEAVARVRAVEYARAARGSAFDDQGSLHQREPVLGTPAADAVDHYRARYLQAFPAGALSGLRLGFFAHSAVGRDLLPGLLESLGAEVRVFGRSDVFVAIDTEALAAATLTGLQRQVDELVAEAGPLDAVLSTDGDSDRPMLLVTGPGGRLLFISGDLLGLAVADYLDVDAVAVPVSSSDAIERHFAGRAVTIERTRIGSPWVIAAMARQEGARRVGWEANGGFLVGSTLKTPGGTLSPLPTRDAVLPLVAALHAARLSDLQPFALFDRFPARYSRAGLLDAVEPALSRRVLERLGPPGTELRRLQFRAGAVTAETSDGSQHDLSGEDLVTARQRAAALVAPFEEALGPLDGLASLDALDGLRLYFGNGEIAHLRPSGNAPQLRLYAVADSPERADTLVAAALAEPDGILRRLLAHCAA